MRQTKKDSFIEALTNTLSGFLLSLILQVLIFPMYDIHVSLYTNVQLVFWFTLLSVARNYIVRRFFNGSIWKFLKERFSLALFKRKRAIEMLKPPILPVCEHLEHSCGCKPAKFKNFNKFKVLK